MNPSEDHAAGIARHSNGPVSGVLLSGAIDGAIHPTPAGIGLNLPHDVDFAGVERRIGAHPPGQLAPVRQGFDHPDAAARRSTFRQATVNSRSDPPEHCHGLPS